MATPEELAAIAEALKEREERKRYRALDFYKPYPKQIQFHNLGRTHHERALIAANRSGKSYSAAAEVAMHLTGIYPSWWQGRVFPEPIRCWVAGETGLSARDICQKLLFGTPGVVIDRGTGMVPRDCVDWQDGTSLAHGYASLYDTVQVKHTTGGISTIKFMTYAQGREKWQGESLDVIWVDEEPPRDVYSEGLTRLADRAGIMLCTFTPLKGMTEVVTRFTGESSPDRAWINMTIEDAGHFSPEERARVIAQYPAYEREARAKGVPMLGEGRVFQCPESIICEPAIPKLPEHWPLMWAIDYGIDHPFAAVLGAWDKDVDCIHIVAAIKMKDSRPIDHAAAMKAAAAQPPVAWPHDVASRDANTGKPLSRIYAGHGLNMLPSHAAFPDGSISTEAGIKLMEERMYSNRLKVAEHLHEWFAEYRIYHRKNGLIVKLNDDLMSATRILCMAIRHAKWSSAGIALMGRGKTLMAKDWDFNPLEI